MAIHNIVLSAENLDVISTGIRIKQNDGFSHKFLISGTDFPNAHYGIIRFLRPDNFPVCDEISFSGSSCEYTLPPVVLGCGGTVTAEVSLYKDNSRITTGSFTFEVVSDINIEQSSAAEQFMPIISKLITKFGDAASALDNIITLQNSYIGGDSV